MRRGYGGRLLGVVARSRREATKLWLQHSGFPLLHQARHRLVVSGLAVVTLFGFMVEDHILDSRHF